MILTDEQIIKLLQEPRNGKSITSGAFLQKHHKYHVTGENYTELVSQVEGYESNADYLNVKKQIAKPATILITSVIIDNLNRWTNAQGTVKKCDFKDPDKNDEFQKVLDQIWNGKSFEDFIQSFVKEAIYTEFNGFALVTKPQLDLENKVYIREGIAKEYEGGNLDPYIIFISISDVKDYFLTGDKVEYLIIKLDDQNKRFRVIDDARDMIVSIEDKSSKTFFAESDIPNELGYVPARMISSINENILNSQVKTSPINHILPALDRYFSCDCDLRMQYIKHLYPKLAIVTRECTSCNGSGKVSSTIPEYKDDKEVVIDCNTCHGTGREIPISRDGVIGIPMYLIPGDSPYPGSPATYITPEVESLKTAAEDLKQQRLDILYAGTGDKNIVAESLNTATENIINSRSLEDRIAEISRMVEQFEIFLKTAVKELHKDFASIEDFEIIVKYGKKIALKNETDLQSEIKDAKSSGMNMSYVQGLQTDLIYVKYKNNKNELERQLLLNDIEPFAGYSIEEVLKMEKYVSDKDLKLKINFESLVDQLENSEPLETIAVGEGYKKRVNVIKEKLYALIPKEEKKEEEQPEEIEVGERFEKPINVKYVK